MPIARDFGFESEPHLTRLENVLKTVKLQLGNILAKNTIAARFFSIYQYAIMQSGPYKNSFKLTYNSVVYCYH